MFIHIWARVCMVSGTRVPWDSHLSTSERVCVWFEHQRRSLASISSDSSWPSGNPSIPHYLTPYYLTHKWIYAWTEGMWPTAASKPASSFICGWIDMQSHSVLRHQQLAEICRCSISIPALNFGVLLCHLIKAESEEHFHLSSVTGEMREFPMMGYSFFSGFVLWAQLTASFVCLSVCSPVWFKLKYLCQKQLSHEVILWNLTLILSPRLVTVDGCPSVSHFPLPLLPSVCS